MMYSFLQVLTSTESIVYAYLMFKEHYFFHYFSFFRKICRAIRLLASKYLREEGLPGDKAAAQQVRRRPRNDPRACFFLVNFTPRFWEP